MINEAMLIQTQYEIGNITDQLLPQCHRKEGCPPIIQTKHKHTFRLH